MSTRRPCLKSACKYCTQLETNHERCDSEARDLSETEGPNDIRLNHVKYFDPTGFNSTVDEGPPNYVRREDGVKYGYYEHRRLGNCPGKLR